VSSLYITDIIYPMPNKKQKEQGVYIRLEPAEREALQSAAKQHDRTLADWVRRATRQKLRRMGFLPMPEKKLVKKKEPGIKP
jgi:hypothetical protein